MRIIFQIFIITILLASWNVSHLTHNFQEENYFEKISQKPIILFCYNNKTLAQLQSKIDTLFYVRKIEIIKKSKIAKTLIQEYQLKDAEDILSKHSLPDILKIYVKGQYFNIKNKQVLKSIILKIDKDISINYNDNYLVNYQNKLQFLKQIFLLINCIFLILILFITVISRVHFEGKNDSYWEIYKVSGGQHNQRKKVFLLNSILLILSPIILNIILYYAVIYFNYLSIQMNCILFIIEGIVLLFSNLISYFFLLKRM